MRIIILLAWLVLSSVHAQSDQEFRVQLLEPLGGKILMPKDWFYKEYHGAPYYVWTLSKEDLDKGPYTTGVKIQLISGIQEGAGKTPEEFLKEYAEGKKQTAKVLSECAEEEQQYFTRICVETIETLPEFGDDKKFRIQYSLFWSNRMDMVIVVISGTLEQLWAENEPIFDAMQAFELIDMKRFE
jgi:hypothetical protein